MQKTIRRTLQINARGNSTGDNLGIVKTRDVKIVRFILSFKNENRAPLDLNGKRVYAYVTLRKKNVGYILEATEHNSVSATLDFDTSVITENDRVRVDVYVEEGEESADAGAFYFSVDVSEIDKGLGEIVAKLKVPSLEELLSSGKNILNECKELFVTKEAGKGLSANDFTDEYKAKLDGGEVVTEDQLNELKRIFGEAIQGVTNSMQSDAFVSVIAQKVYEKKFGLHTPFARHYTFDRLRDDLPDNTVVSMLKEPEHPDQGYNFYIKIKGKWERIGA